MKARLIVNPVSGTDSAPDYLPAMNARLREAFDELDIALTVSPGDARSIAEHSVEQGYKFLFVAGGDGTLNEAINGVASVDAGLERITFGVVPLGTGNDFAVALGLPNDALEALEIMLGGRALQTDVGVVNDQHFVNVSAGGFIAEVSDAVNPQLKTIAGRLAYIIGGAQVLLDYSPVAAGIKATLEDGRVKELKGGVELFAVCNSRLVGGGQPIAPDALIDDGLLDVCIVEEMSTIEFLGLLGSVPAGGHIEDERVAYFRSREIDFNFDRSVKVNTDGEVFEAAVCRYRILPRAARFLAGNAPFAQG